MNEREFTQKKREDWERLAALTEKANGRRGLRGLSREELLALGPLYRRVASDLAAARARAISPDLTLHLNAIVGQAQALLYSAQSQSAPGRAAQRFYMTEFPALLQKYRRYFFAAIAISILGAIFAYWVVITQPDKTGLFIPEQFKSSLDAWKSGKLADDAHAEFSAELMTHNLLVGILASTTGVAGGVPTVGVLFENGTTLGAFSAVMTQVHQHAHFWPGILPHGIAELTAIFICGGAGLLFGVALLLPRPYSRADALRIYGMDAIKLTLGTIPLFIFAGVIEGMFSHLAIPPALRYAFAATNGVLWYLYLFLPRRSLPDAAPTENARNLPPD